MEYLKNIYEYLSQYCEISMEDLMPLLGNLKEEELKAEEVLFSDGESYKKVTFVTYGLLKKVYLNADGKEYIKEFVWEGQSSTPYASLLMGTPATYTMKAIEKTKLLTIDYSFIEDLSKKNPKWTEIIKSLANMHFVNREIREMELLKFSALERYLSFKEKYPKLIDRLKRQDIAMYLGITPTSLSRLDKELN